MSSKTIVKESQATIMARCAGFVETSRTALEWISLSENKDTVGVKRDPIERTLRRSMRRAGKLRDAAATNMAVSVFGPSQNGKSFLVSVLARPENKPLVSAFNDPNGNLSYIREINPAGEGESTGLVTRFTMTRDKTPDGFPIMLHMLSVGDVIQTLSNSFFMDGDQSEDALTSSAIEEHLEKFTSRAQPDCNNGLTSDDVWEIADYIERNFKSYTYTAGLSGFWEKAARIGPNLPISQLGAFFAPIWGGYEMFSNVFQRLAQGLQSMGFARTTFARMDALVPRHSSIIDVAQLYMLDKEDTFFLELSLDGNKAIKLQRSIVSALTAEFVLPMKDLPDPIFDEVDLLDFPGARNRFSKPLAGVFADTKDGGIGRLILRGKVAYLFDRYVEDQKINAMLLCIKDSNMETIDLPRLIENWISLTQGRTPKMRAKAACILFFCLTFFDKHLVDSAAGAEDRFRFDKRMDESLIKGFSSGGWVTEWRSGQAFDNSFWIRNPNFPAEPFFEYDRSTDPWSESNNLAKAERLQELKLACLSVPLVQTHFADPETAWNAAMEPNDGGISYLKTNLRKVCNLSQKIDQIAVQIGDLEKTVDAELRWMYISDNFDKRLIEKQKLADFVLDGLVTSLDRQTFAQLLAAMMVDFDDVMDLMSKVPADVRLSSASSAIGSAPEAKRRLLPRRGSAPVEKSETPEEDTLKSMTRPEFQTSVVIKNWIDRLEALKRDRSIERTYGLTSEAMTDIATELVYASRRVDLAGQIKSKLESVSFGLSLEGQARPAALIACEIVNRFVSTFGMADVPISERPMIEGNPEAGDKPRAVFATSPARANVDDLAATPRQTLEEFFQNWAYALDHAFVQNASFVAGGQINNEQNKSLGTILHKLQGAQNDTA